MTSRREFLKSLLALAAAGASFHPLAALAAQEKARNCLVVGADMAACFVDLEKFTTRIVSLGFSAHSFLPHPNHPSRFIVPEKWGPSAAEVDFEKGTARPLPSEPDYQFYGHGIYVPKKKAVFLGRVEGKSGLGFMTGYDPETYKILYDYQVTPGGLHDIHLMPDGKYMVSSSGLRGAYASPTSPLTGDRVAPSSLVRVDLAGNGKVVGELAIDDPEQVIGHYALTKTGQILALSGRTPTAKTQYGRLYYSADGIQPLKKLDIPKELRKPIDDEIFLTGHDRPAASREMLSFALNEDHSRIAVTLPAARRMLLVDMKEVKIIKTVEQFAQGVAFDNKRGKFVGSGRELSFVDPDFASLSWQTLRNEPRVNGSHSLLLPSKIG